MLLGLCRGAEPGTTVSYEIDGGIEQKYIRLSGESGILTNWFHVSVSGCRSAIRTGSMGDKVINYFEYVSDGTNSELVIRYNPFEALTAVAVPNDKGGLEAHKLAIPEKPINQANVTINSSTVPEYGFGLITPVWIAYASSCFFQQSKTDQIEPIFFMGAGFREHHLKVKANWSLAAKSPELPEWMHDFTDGKLYKEEHETLITTESPEPFDKPTTNSIYSVSSWTNAYDLHLPLRWQLIQYRPNDRTRVLEPKIIATGYTTAVRKGTSRTSFEIWAPEFARVTDRTLEAQGVPVRQYTYLTTNGNLLALSGMEKQPGFAAILAAGQRGVHAPGRRVFLFGLIFVILCFPLIPLRERRRGSLAKTNP